ncbi:hypothetical protein LWI28_007554 [Acer negundo]|uniref:DNA polymerase zeta catalytic subunit N-terminal domain-containing protein n=1 Tax=Acer negundo TaxID=4023 RepID=A0AAD5NWR0_ACENE|nr:hypothetical protein LWI28_007554 [Acer negundo]
MADSQTDSKLFSVRIVSIDHYMVLPIHGFDFCYSNFQGDKVHEVQIIRVYGSTPAVQKTCLHVHRKVFFLQIDYNLYGMGHLHLLKVKFRHPVPDVFTTSQFDGLSDQNIKRQIVCELEGDATVDDIVNQQFKTYTSLSTAPTDVKMVQSLLPIWEVEYERTEMCEAAMPPDPGKSLPQAMNTFTNQSLNKVLT